MGLKDPLPGSVCTPPAPAGSQLTTSAPCRHQTGTFSAQTFTMDWPKTPGQRGDKTAARSPDNMRLGSECCLGHICPCPGRGAGAIIERPQILVLLSGIVLIAVTGEEHRPAQQPGCKPWPPRAAPHTRPSQPRKEFCSCLPSPPPPCPSADSQPAWQNP